ncbi:MAG TPA: potassium-transporting ATPase subunit KdpC [Polyangiaceae bacterium]|nr:potassium-transporting ATPase subunit KdpC [Polyangiaceae bacterium]
MKQLRPLFVITLALFVLCCLVYPGVVTAAAQILLPDRANGSLVERNGKVVGSALIGQSVADFAAHPEYLWGRASAASNDAATGITYSSGSNYGPLNSALVEEVKARVALLRASGVDGPIPVDLVTKSASGLDPHVSPASAELQVPRIASTRKITESKVKELISKHTEQSTLGFLGEARVNVLLVNLDLDSEAPYAASPPAPSAAPAK